jgi:hypothetical protein
VENMKLNRDELKDACYQVATNTMWDLRPVDVADIQSVADKFFRIAEQQADLVSDRDPNLVVRAVRYLNHAHAIPPMRDDTQWFSDMLQVLVELACPDNAGSPELEPFYRDIEEGIAISRADYHAAA